MLYFLRRNPKDSMYKENRVGPKTDPWGTPQQIGAKEVEYCPIVTEKDLSDR